MFVIHSGLRPRNPVTRLIGWVLGLLAVLGVLALGFFAFVAILVVGAVWMLVNALRGYKRPPARPAPKATDSGIIDGEFIVVRESEKRTRIEAASIATNDDVSPR
jgi:hypothetical protein